VNCEWVSGIAGGTFHLDRLYLGTEVRLRIEMVMTLNLSGVDEKVLK
jgi:hypothetical protein